MDLSEHRRAEPTVNTAEQRLPGYSRRQLLARSAQALYWVSGLGSPCVAAAHSAVGRVNPPLSPPHVPLQLQDESHRDLQTLLRGKASAVQLMFGGCTSSCPIQGALFAQARSLLPPTKSHRQLLSLSVDPLGDDPAALRRWLARFQSGSAAIPWLAARPAVNALEPWLNFLQASQTGRDRHSTQVYYFNTQAELVLRSTDLPSASAIAAQLLAL